MGFDSIIDIQQLNKHLHDPDWVVIDCRYNLTDPGFGKRSYLNGHIPGAVFADINTHLSSPVIPGKTGRHPLPEIAAVAQTFSEWGIDQNVQVVAYDDGGGKYAARLWWLLYWLGHTNVAVLNGGLQAWEAAGNALDQKTETKSPRKFTPTPQPQMILDLTQLAAIPDDIALIDSRSPGRYAGKVEPIDPVAGRIPGAQNHFFQKNLQKDLAFHSLEKLRQQFQNLTGEKQAADVVFYCGSGITASHNILSMYTAGLGMAKLYPGSWSEWITDPNRPIETDN